MFSYGLLFRFSYKVIKQMKADCRAIWLTAARLPARRGGFDFVTGRSICIFIAYRNHDMGGQAGPLSKRQPQPEKPDQGLARKS